jgi:hypothetical protein
LGGSQRECEIGTRKRFRIGLDTELRTDAESGVGMDPEAHADSPVKYKSEAGWGARLESGLD